MIRTIRWSLRHFRRVVFIEEQGVSEAEEIDDLDAAALHLLARLDGRPVGTARLLRQGDTGKTAVLRCCERRVAPDLALA